MSSVKKYVVITLISLVLIFVAYGSFMIFGTHSESSRVGQLYKFGKKGIIFKTYEGELSIFTKGAIGEKWAFSVNSNDTEVIEKLEEAMGKEVTLHYSEKYVQMPWAGETKYFVNKVEIVK
jgi:hypothetical protein